MDGELDRNFFISVREAARKLSALAPEGRDNLLESIAAALEGRRGEIEEANRQDTLAAEGKIPPAMLKRLALSGGKLDSAIEGVRAVKGLGCPTGVVKEKRLLDEGLVLEKVTFPIGVIGMVFEARPEALIQIVSLAVKSGNGIVLKGGSEARLSNAKLVEIIHSALGDYSDCVGLLSSRSDVDSMLKMEGLIDLIIPRGSNAFVRHCMENTHIPVMGHADGICSVFVEKSADFEMAARICVDSKVQYPAACNACETILVDRPIADAFIPVLGKALEEKGVTIHGDETVRRLLGDSVVPATEDDFHTEYLALEVAVKVVDGTGEAISHISAHGSGHTDSIITNDSEAKAKFFALVDSADVFCNCSTRFSDGFRFGLGAEVGISTSKLHARGPVGLEGLTTTKWLLSGSGQVVADYSGPGARRFIHEDLPL